MYDGICHAQPLPGIGRLHSNLGVNKVFIARNVGHTEQTRAFRWFLVTHSTLVDRMLWPTADLVLCVHIAGLFSQLTSSQPTIKVLSWPTAQALSLTAMCSLWTMCAVAQRSAVVATAHHACSVCLVTFLYVCACTGSPVHCAA